MSQIDTFQQERLQALLDANKTEYDLKLAAMKQTLLKYNDEVNRLSNGLNQNKLEIFSLESQVASLTESMHILVFNGQSIKFNVTESCSCFGRLN